MALTQDTIQSRILGLSETAQLSTRSLFLATGNNLRLKGDLTRRAVICRLDAEMENPEERVFDFDALDEVRRNRGQMVVDVLTIVRAYINAKQPVQLAAFGSFEEWAIVRGALVWLDQADPLETKDILKEENPDLEEKAEVFCALLSTYRIGHTFTVREIGVLGDAEDLAKSRIAQFVRVGRWEGRSAGRLLQRLKDKPYHGVTLRSKAHPIKARVYKFEGEPDEELRSVLNEDVPM